MNQYNIHNIKIDPAIFQHPAEKKATQLIQSQKGFNKALQYISKNSLERQLACIYQSSIIQLTPRMAPKIYRMIEEACDMFDVQVTPVVFFERNYSFNITMLGIEKPMILFPAELLKQLDEYVLWGLLASEISGIRNGFSEIRFVEWLCRDSGLIPEAISDTLKIPFQNWHKYLQFSYDRANLIATGDLNMTMCGVLAGETSQDILKRIDFNDPNCDYMKQCKEFLTRTGNWTEAVRDYKAFAETGVFYAVRYINLFKFVHEEYYDLVEDFMED